VVPAFAATATLFTRLSAAAVRLLRFVTVTLSLTGIPCRPRCSAR
jgi:hypothetical protein